MTREMFMEHAEKEIDSILASQKNRLMNLVCQAWAEGKKNAEYEVVEEMTHDWLKIFEEQLDKKKDILSNFTTTFIPDACRGCSIHPTNGGTGNCNCTLGMPPIT